MSSIYDRLQELFENDGVRAAAILLATLIAAKVIERVVVSTFAALARRTANTIDDAIAAAIRRPISLSVLFIGIALALDQFPLTEKSWHLALSALATLGTLVWASAAHRIGLAVLESLSRRGGTEAIVQPRTLPIFEMLVKIVVVGTAVYFLFLSWSIDLTAWLASAGIIGIAIGFAAKDTLSNLFSGIFIVADAPYKLGDFIVLDGDLRGQVTKIGIRSTRMLTMDDVEVTVPNAVIGNAKIVNETGGPSIRSRMRVEVDAAYGSDIDLVREVLLGCPTGVANVAVEPAPQVRFAEFGDSGLRFQLFVWLERPSERGFVIDALHCAIYKRFTAAGIEIPYAKRDVYIKELPQVVSASAATRSG